MSAIRRSSGLSARLALPAALLPCASLLALAACTTGPKPQSVAAPTFPTAQEQAEVKAAPPPPALAEAGSARDVWQLRSALNVAALGCQQGNTRNIGPRYNAMLKQHNTLFTQAYVAEEARYRQAHGARWQTVQDREATQLYNRYASHPDLARYCAEADVISEDALRVPTEDFARFAAAALPRLEAPAFVPKPPAPKPVVAKAPAKKPVAKKKA